MRVLNRLAVTITGGQPYLDWTLGADADANKGAITVAHVRTYGSAFLFPEDYAEEDLQEWVEENAEWLFEFQLAEWTEDDSAWPKTRNLQTFREWFRIDIHSVVVDVAGDEIDGEEM